MTKCDPADSCAICLNNGINAPLDLFKKLKENGLPLPIKHPNRDEYLSYEESKIHDDRKIEKLPSQNFKIKSPLKFKLSKNRARTTISCSECKKPRVVYKERKPSKTELGKFEDEIDSLIWTCGSGIEFDEYEVNRNISCKDNLESPLYSELTDKFGADLLCKNCGSLVPEKCVTQYLDLKTKYSLVKPCCDLKHCRKNKKVKWEKTYPKGSIVEFVHKDKFERKMKTLKRKKESEGNNNNERKKRRKRQHRYNIFQKSIKKKSKHLMSYNKL